jgi:UDP-GlcNAc:undecaprenyl-phosphate GlcNAc-1-phosphate transferase
MESSIIHLPSVLLSFISSFFFIYFCYDFSLTVGLYDKPNWRKKDSGKIPLIGGIAIIFGFLLGCLISPRALSEWRPLFLCIIPLVLIGVMDDHGDISVTKRLVAQFLTCLIMIYHGGIYLSNFGDLFGLGFDVTFKGIEVGVTIFCVIGVINALNLIDGIDGLCASLSIIACISITIVVLLQKEASASISLIIYFSSSLIAFLINNLGITKRIIGKVFLGDTGTTVIGLFLSWYLIKLSSFGSEQVFKPIFAAWVMAVPIMDTLSVMIRRIISKKSPLKPGRDHIHHLFLDNGFSSKCTLWIISIFAILLSAIGIVCEINNVAESYLFYSIIIVFSVYFFVLEYFWKRTIK